MGVHKKSARIRTNCDDMVALPYLIAISILCIVPSYMYDSYRCMEDFFKALICVLVLNIWRIYVYAPKPHLTFSRYDESLMMTSIGFYIFGPQINKVVRGVGQRLSRGVCHCVCVCVCLFKQSHPASDCKMFVLIGSQARPCLRCDAPELAELWLVFQVFFFFLSNPCLRGCGSSIHYWSDPRMKAETLSGDRASWPHTEKKKTAPWPLTLCENKQGNSFFLKLISKSAWEPHWLKKTTVNK